MRADRRLAAALTRIRPVALLGPTCVVQVLVALALALTTSHNGWLWYSGGDATEYWSEQWSLAHGLLPHTYLGVGLPALYAWIPLVAGPTLLHGLPVVIVLQLVVGLPLATVGLWAVADRIGGRLFAWWATLVWLVGPLLLARSFRSDYRDLFVEYFLVPHWYGFTDMADFASIVIAIWAAWACLRAFDTRDTRDAALAGLLIGALVAVKPSNAVFLAAPAAGFVLLRLWRCLAVTGAAALPSLAVLALWKERGIGSLPVLSLAPHREAAAARAPVGSALTNRYLQLDWGAFTTKLAEIREVTWSLRFLEFLAIAGALGLIRRSPARGTFVVAWFAGYCLVKGNSPRASVPQMSFWRLTAPGLVAYVLLASAVVLLLPRRRRLRRPAAPEPARGITVAIAVVAVLFVALPLVTVAVAHPMRNGEIVRYTDNTEAPQSDAFHLRVSGTRLAWDDVDSGRTKAWYAVYRSDGGDGCSYDTQGGRECVLDAERIALTRETTLELPAAASRRWYRVSLVASQNAAEPGGDLMLVSRAVAAR